MALACSGVCAAAAFRPHRRVRTEVLQRRFHFLKQLGVGTMTLVADTRTAPQLPVPFSRRWKAENTTKGVHVEKCSVDNASFYMLNLYRANLQVRLSAIDPASLQTRAQHDLYAAVSDILAAPADC